MVYHRKVEEKTQFLADEWHCGLEVWQCVGFKVGNLVYHKTPDDRRGAHGMGIITRDYTYIKTSVGGSTHLEPNRFVIHWFDDPNQYSIAHRKQLILVTEQTRETQ